MLHWKTGLLTHDAGRATQGFTLLSPLHDKTTYLVDMNGELRHSWSHPLVPGNYAYLLPSGNLLWGGETAEGPHPGGGKGGLLREYDWDGNVVWEFRDDRQHHDFRRLPNGNTIYIGWEPIPAEYNQRILGAEPGSELDGVIWGDFLHEITPDGEVVWDWHTYLHMDLETFPLHAMSTRSEFVHTNSVAVLPNGDILLSMRKISTILIIDRATKRVRWHRRDDNWGQQHDAEMLANGNILFFANGHQTPPGIPSSRVVELDPRTGKEAWAYRGTPFYTFFSPHVSGAQRLASGNTLICEGIYGRIFEVTPAGEIVWEFVCPWSGPFAGGQSTSVFRAYRYAWDSPEIRGRLGRP